MFVSLPFIFNSPQEADAKLDGAGGKKLDEYFHLMVYIVWVWLKTDLENLQIVNAL